jgi:hypothetical protein
MAAGLLSGVTDALFGSVDNQQYLQQYALEQVQAQEARRREAQAYAAQQNYGQYLQAVMNGTAPSMAQLQLQQGLGAIAQQQQSMAAGIGGPGQALARYGAAVNTGNAQTAMNQAAAMARAKEIADARTAYGANAAGMQQASANMYNSGSQNALGYAQVASGNAIGETNQRNSMQGAGALLQGLGQAGAAYFGRQPDTSSKDGG